MVFKRKLLIGIDIDEFPFGKIFFCQVKISEIGVNAHQLIWIYVIGYHKRCMAATTA
jgi:hypothetical protein